MSLSAERGGVGGCGADVGFFSIESMKMETVIRSPQKGVVKRLAHKEGVSFLGGGLESKGRWLTK